MTVTEKIGNEYENWKPSNIYLINAGTGQGKSYFVTNELYQYTERENKKILLLCNRSILKAQFDEDLKDKNIDILMYQELEYHDRRHNLDPIKKKDQFAVKEILNQYDYVVLDEAHYIYSDSPFNKYTDVIEKALEECNAVMIMLSATPILLKKEYANKIKKEYIIKSDYSYINKVIYYQSKETIYKLLNAIPDDEKAMIFANNTIRLKELYKEYKSCSYYLDSKRKYSNKKKNILSKPVQQIVEDQKVDKRFLFCTKVLDNGINIKDNVVKHIFIEMDDLIDFVQCLGRKRVLDENDTVTLYFYNYTSFIEQAKYQDLKKQEQIYQDSIHLPNNIFREKYRKKELPNFFENEYGIIQTTFKYFKYKFNFIEKIVNQEIYFQDLIRRILGKRSRDMVKYDAPTLNKDLSKFLSKNKGKKLFLKEKEKVIAKFSIRKNNKLIDKIDELNSYLANNSIPFIITSGREGKEGAHRNMHYWVIEEKLGSTSAQK